MSTLGGQLNPGWIGVDLDGTWAYWGPGSTVSAIGPALPKCTYKVQAYLREGYQVKVFTARVASNQAEDFIREQKKLIQTFTLKEVGIGLESTAEKDFNCIKILDDRAEQMMENTGLTLREFLEEKAARTLRGQL